MMKNWKQIAGLLAILAVAVVACASPGTLEGVAEGERARDFTLKTLDGSQISLRDYEGQVVLVNFWGTWCPPCADEIPDLEAVYQARQDDGFVILGVNVRDHPQMVESFVADLGVSYPVVLDEADQVSQEYRVRGLPLSVLVDRDGVIRVRHIGYLSAEQLLQYLAEVLP
jgi:peroxiredoxin